MATNNINTKRGFTIIEVVLVLAIAGLIFLMVFIALPNMQRSQRDTQRRNDYSALSANITAYITNNNGSLPEPKDANPLILDSDKYLNTTGLDPDGMPYYLAAVKCGSTVADTECGNDAFGSGPNGISGTAQGRIDGNTQAAGHKVFVVTRATCKNGVPYVGRGTRSFAIYGYLETGTGTYCQSSDN